MCLFALSGVLLACAPLHAADVAKQPDAADLLKQMRAFQKAGASAKALETANQIVAMADATTDQKFAAYGQLLSACHGGWSTETPQWDATYMALKSEAECEAMKVNALKCLARMHALKPEDADTRLAYGAFLAYLGNNQDAIKVLEPALKVDTLSGRTRAMIYMRLADAALGMSDREQCRRYLEELGALNLNTAQRYGESPAETCREALAWMRGIDLDALKLPMDTGAKVFPTPQNAQYARRFVAPVSVRVSGLPADDARVLLLRTKFERFGIPFDDKAKFIISVNEGKLKAPEKEEGYALSVTKEGATLQGRDTIGTTWAIVSLIQLVDQPKRRVRLCSISDWPETPQRGHLSSGPDSVEIALFSKLSAVARQGAATAFHGLTPLRLFISLEPVRVYKPFGIRYYLGDRSLHMYPKYPLTSERTFQLNRDWMMTVAAAGGNCLFLYDDGRYPLHPRDIEINRCGANQDAKFVTRLFREVRAKYPEFRLIYCPPFYWGPYYSTTFKALQSEPGGDERDAYNRSIAKDMDPAIDLFWTGERMIAYDIEKRDTDWARQAFGRKPFIWQNRPLPHQYHWGAIVDAVPWSQWQYDGFGDDVTGFMANQATPNQAVQLAAMNEALWHRRAYDRRDTVKRATELFFGKGMFEILEPGSKAFYWMDNFMREGQFTPYILKHLDEYEKAVRTARKAYDKAMAKDAFRLKLYGGVGGYSYQSCLNVAENHLKTAKAVKPDYFQTRYAGNIAANRALAAKESSLDEAKGDIFRTPADMDGGQWMGAERTNTVFGILLRGVLLQPRPNFAGIEFEPARPGPYELILAGEHELHKDRPGTWRILVNGKLLYEGATGFKEKERAVVKHLIPANMLKRKNLVRIESTMAGGTPWNGPWILLNYAIFRPAN